MPTQSVLFRTIKPAKAIKASVFNQFAKAELERIADGMLKDFLKTTRTWKHKPKFKKIIKFTGEPKRAEVTTTDRIYGYVNFGTPPHIIRPRKKGGVLVFPAKSTPKTTPRLISSRAGSSSKQLVFAREVRHPGIKARRFDLEITKKWRPQFKARMQVAYNKAARASGYMVGRKI